MPKLPNFKLFFSSLEALEAPFFSSWDFTVFVATAPTVRSSIQVLTVAKLFLRELQYSYYAVSNLE